MVDKNKDLMTPVPPAAGAAAAPAPPAAVKPALQPLLVEPQTSQVQTSGT